MVDEGPKQDSLSLRCLHVVTNTLGAAWSPSLCELRRTGRR